MIFETINVMAPLLFEKGLASGELVRTGMIIKEASSGKIVGHMKEVGDLTNTLTGFPVGLDPLSGLSNAYQGVQLQQIKQSLETLQLISSVGAVASVATLGVCVAGFTVVTNKLNKLDKKLDVVLGEIQRVKELLEEINEDNNMLKFAEVETAYLQLDKALAADTKDRREKLLEESSSVFSKYKRYYLKVAQYKNLWEDNLIPLDISNDLFSRYVTCALGEIYSEILLGDLSVANKAWEQINKELQSINHFDKLSVFRAHSDQAMENHNDINLDALKQNVKFTDELIRETSERINSMSYEIKYLEKTKIEPIEYMRQLKNMEDGIVVVPAV